MKGLYIKGKKETIDGLIDQIRPLLWNEIDTAEINPIILSEATKEQVEDRLQKIELEE